MTMSCGYVYLMGLEVTRAYKIGDPTPLRGTLHVVVRAGAESYAKERIRNAPPLTTPDGRGRVQIESSRVASVLVTAVHNDATTTPKITSYSLRPHNASS